MYKALCKASSYIQLLLLTIASANYATEQILSFHSQIKINSDASLDIIETIQVQVEHHQIKRGITRTIPICYHSDWGLRQTTEVAIKQILLDGLPVPYHTQKISNSLLIKIGSPNKLVSLGKHTYQIEYHTDRILLFGNQFAKLYYNVIGNDVSIPILQASASVYLPQMLPDQDIKLAGYTGVSGSKLTNFHSWIDQDGTIQFQTTQRLKPNESFTINVLFPKLTIKEPSIWTRIKWFLFNNVLILLMLISLCLLILTWIDFLRRYYQTRPTITPLFYPPKDLLPWQVGHLYYMTSNPNIFTATIVDLAIKGYLIIQPPTGATKYELIKLDQPTTPNSFYDQLAVKLFDSETRLKLENFNSKTRGFEDKLNANPYKDKLQIIANYYVFYFSVLTATLGFIQFNTPSYNSPFSIIALVIAVGILAIMLVSFKKYNDPVANLRNQALGFKMYLSITEKKRLEALNAPTQTIELYEQYLPYAIALGVDKQWANAFAAIFSHAGTYQPYWYSRSKFHPNKMGQLHSDLNNLIYKKYYSNNSSGGSSGSGKGGGGIGGW